MCALLSNPVMLTVGKTTTLSLNVGNPDFEFSFPVSGRLLYNGEPVANKWIQIKVNGTEMGYAKTASDGTYSLTLKLKPVNNTATLYPIEAAFHGDNALNLTLYDTAPDGTSYALCTTLHYSGFKPAANTATLIVDPKSTQLNEREAFNRICFIQQAP